MSQSIVINRMPVRVWRRPRVNEIEVLLKPAQSIASPGSFVIENPEELMLSRHIPETGFKSRGADYFVPEALSAFIAGSAAERHHIRIHRGYAQAAPLVAALQDGSWQAQWPFPLADSLVTGFAAASDSIESPLTSGISISVLPNTPKYSRYPPSSKKVSNIVAA